MTASRSATKPRQRRPRPTEAQEQAALFQWVRLQQNAIPELALLHHIPNGGLRSKVTAARLKAMGVRPGVFDLFLPVSRRGFHGLYIELKAEGGKLSEAQAAWAQAVLYEGYAAVICRSFDQAKECLLTYLAEDGPQPMLITLQ